ncbi:MAG: hypothetical protein H6695_14970 [Deferribacteres bacterium]|nr:hypothetical protein [candidate division KSB1 bacterium]MCB9511488.1 hypothetical protein [Deferribacteres bacterium]
MKFKNVLIPRKIQQLRADLKEKGLKKFVMDMGWKVALGIFLYYLIRDSILYILIPYLIARGMLS